MDKPGPVRHRRTRTLRCVQNLLAAVVLALGVLVMHGIAGTDAQAVQTVEAAQGHPAHTAGHVSATPDATGCAECGGMGAAMACALVMLLMVVLVPGPRTTGVRRPGAGPLPPLRIPPARHRRTPSIRELCISRT